MVKVAHLEQRRMAMVVEMIGALILITVSILPIAGGIQQDRMLIRRAYERAVLMHLIDGELELLHAGLAGDYPPGTHDPYAVHGEAAQSLPDGTFTLIVSDDTFLLCWEDQRGLRRSEGQVRRQP